jgi:rhodanese-related sulfurtransferase
MRKWSLIFVASLFLFSPVWAQITAAPMITAQTAKDLLTSEKNVLLLDVRTYEEFVSRRIPGSTLFPSSQINSESAARIIGIDLEKILIVYCASGGRSKVASLALLSLGYKNVWNLGALSAWPFETITGEPTTDH